MKMPHSTNVPADMQRAVARGMSLVCRGIARRFIQVSLLAILLSCAPGLLFAEVGGSWTNRAGHALLATPQSIRGQNVTFVLTKTGKTVAYPLGVFLETEQERLRCALNDTTLPAGLADAFAFSCRIIKRSRLLNENGSMSVAEYEKAVATTLAAFRKQSAPYLAKKQLSPERLELILRKMVAEEN